MNSFIQRKLNLALFAGASMLGAALPTHAAVVYTNLTATPLSIPSSVQGIYLNIITGATGSSGAGVSGWDLNPYNNNTGLTFYGAASPSGILATGTPGTGAVATALSFGALIADGQYNQFQTQGTSFFSGGTAYLGFRFLNEGTGAINYGWALISNSAGTSNSLGFPASILGYAYENTGASITAGQTGVVPEPATYAMFGMGLLGAAGLSAWRRRRAA